MTKEYFIINHEIDEDKALRMILEILKWKNSYTILCGPNYQSTGKNIVQLITFMNDKNTNAFAWINEDERIIDKKKELPFCPTCNILLDNYKCMK